MVAFRLKMGGWLSSLNSITCYDNESCLKYCLKSAKKNTINRLAPLTTDGANMNQQPINNPHTINYHSERTGDQNLSQKDLTAVDNLPNVMNALASGKKLKNHLLNSVLEQIQSCGSRNELSVFVKKYFPHITHRSKGVRALIFTINEKLTTFGVAPAWRGFSLPEITNIEEVDQLDYQVMYDMRIIDLQWLHAQRNEGFSSSEPTSDHYRELMNKEVFDYELAHKLATLHTDRLKSIDELGICEDVQRDLIVYKTLEIAQEQKTIMGQRSEVEKDIQTAAHRNPRMGKKLLEVMHDRLDQWMSTQVTQSKSKTVMYETYKKITGSNISASSYNTKLQSLKNALIWANSKFMI